jgi:hypothetical protein
MDADAVAIRAGAVLDAHHRPEGYAVPSASIYPYRWLWDSAFHAVVRAGLGQPEAGAAELRFAHRHQHPSGFVAHVDHVTDPGAFASFWGRLGDSTITQPPVAGHAVAVLARATGALDERLALAAAAHLRFCLGRRHPSGLPAVVHPWETGCDDSPRWDHWGAGDPAGWWAVKGALVAGLRLDADGAAVGSDVAGFDCAPVSFAAICAWGARELFAVAPGIDDTLAADAEAVVDALAGRWDAELRCWVDAGASEATSGRTRTVEGLFPLLVEDRPEVRAAVLADLADPAVWAGRYGPRGVHPDEPAYEPGRYWRGGVWAPLAYLLDQAGAPAATVARPATVGAVASGWAEWWHADTAAPGGAVPQSWTGLVALLARR